MGIDIEIDRQDVMQRDDDLYSAADDGGDLYAVDDGDLYDDDDELNADDDGDLYVDDHDGL